MATDFSPAIFRITLVKELGDALKREEHAKHMFTQPYADGHKWWGDLNEARGRCSGIAIAIEALDRAIDETDS